MPICDTGDMQAHNPRLPARALNRKVRGLCRELHDRSFVCRICKQGLHTRGEQITPPAHALGQKAPICDTVDMCDTVADARKKAPATTCIKSSPIGLWNLAARLFVFLMVGLVSLTQGSSSHCSVSTCAQLGWTDEFGSASVCAASDAPPLSTCSGYASWTAAAETCENVGARLCTLDELVGDEARGTGCDYDYEIVWSATECGTDGHFVTRGASYIGEDSHCAVNSAMHRVRCCADVTCDNAARKNRQLASGQKCSAATFEELEAQVLKCSDINITASFNFAESIEINMEITIHSTVSAVFDGGHKVRFFNIVQGGQLTAKGLIFENGTVSPICVA